jgi:hypothetical protein
VKVCGNPGSSRVARVGSVEGENQGEAVGKGEAGHPRIIARGEPDPVGEVGYIYLGALVESGVDDGFHIEFVGGISKEGTGWGGDRGRRG